MTNKKTKSKEVDLSGKEFFVSDTEQRLLSVYVERRKQAESGLDYFAGAMDDARRSFFAVFFELYPEWEKYIFNYNAEEGRVELLNKKPGAK